MVVIGFNEAGLREALSRLSIAQGAAFAVSCAGRLSNDVSKVQLASLYEGILSEANGAIWRAIFSGEMADFALLEEQLLEAMPDEDDDGSFEAALVEDALAAMAYTIRFLQGGEIDNAVWAARRAYDTCDRYASHRINISEYSDEAEAAILESNVVQNELTRQSRDLKVLSANSGDVHSGLMELKKFSETEVSILNE